MRKPYNIVQTAKFKRDLKRIRCRGYDLASLGKVVDLIAAGGRSCLRAVETTPCKANTRDVERVISHLTGC